MGKVRKLRQKYHTLKSKQSTTEINEESAEDLNGVFRGPGGTSEPNQSLIDQLFTPETLMAAPKITSQLLKQQFADFEERNTIATTLSAKSSTYAQMKKKTKQNLRHQLWQKKFEAVQVAELEAKAGAKRAKKAVIGDLRPMMDALSDMSSFLKDVSKEREKKISDGTEKYRPLKKQKARAKEQSQNIATMTAVMNDPYFQADSFAAISTHLKLKFPGSKP